MSHCLFIIQLDWVMAKAWTGNGTFDAASAESRKNCILSVKILDTALHHAGYQIYRVQHELSILFNLLTYMWLRHPWWARLCGGGWGWVVDIFFVLTSSALPGLMTWHTIKYSVLHICIEFCCTIYGFHLWVGEVLLEPLVVPNIEAMLGIWGNWPICCKF